MGTTRLSARRVRAPRRLLPTLLAAIVLVLQIPAARQAPVAFAAGGLEFADRRPFGGARDQSYAVVAGDMNGDGHLDLVVGKSNQSGQQSAVYLNDGAGNFPFGAGLTCDTPRVRCFGAAGGWVASLAVGDMDGDGALDIVVGYSSGAPSAVFLNDGHGNFGGIAPPLCDNPGTPPFMRCFGAGSGGTARVAVGDMNGDGAFDIVAGGSGFSGSGQGAVYLNDGAGHFAHGAGDVCALASAICFGGAAAQTSSIALGDIDNDGHVDIVAGDSAGQGAAYLNNGQTPPAFGTTRLFGTPTAATQQVALGDLNDDGWLDIVTGDGGSGVAYLNAGAGTFPNAASLPCGSPGVSCMTGSASSLALGDVNGDGVLDAVTGGFYDDSIQINDGTGNFPAQSRIIFGSGANRTQSIALADFDGDGVLDAAVANADSIAGQQSIVWRGNGAGSFASYRRGLGRVALGDLNGDGALDIVGSKTVLLNDGAGVFPGASFTPDPSSTIAFGGGNDFEQSVALGDMNGDGRLDIVVGDRSGQSQVYLNGDGPVPSFGASAPFGPPGAAASVAVGDMDSDGRLDIVAGSASQPNTIYFNQGGSPPSFVAHPLAPAASATGKLALGDVNGDGLLDIISANAGQQSQIFLNQGGRGFSAGINLGTPYDSYSGVALGDLNDDGWLDIVAVTGTFNGAQQNLLMLNDGTGGFPNVRSFGTGGDNSYDVALADMEGDGDLDIVLANSTRNNGNPDTIYVNDGTGDFAVQRVLGGTQPSFSCCGVAVGDLNGDGAPDIVSNGWIHINGRPQDVDGPSKMSGANRLANNPPRVTVARPGVTGNAGFFSTPELFSGPTIPISYTLYDPEGDGVRAVRASYSLDGGGSWRPAIAAAGTITSELSADPTYRAVAVPLEGFLFGNAGTLVSLGDDSVAGPFDIGFPLNFYGRNVSQFWISSNGWISFSPPQTAAPLNTCLPDGTAPADMIAPFWDNLNPAAGGQVSFMQLDNSLLYIEYSQVPNADGSGTYTFQAMIRRDGTITFRYFDMQGNLNGATIGVQNGSRQHAVQLACDTGYAQTGSAVRLAPQGQPHVFNWDTFASGVFGQSDNVVFRLEAIPGTHATPGGVSGPFQRPYVAMTTFPFRVRGTQVRVVDQQGHPAVGAQVYRLPAGRTAGALPVPNVGGRPFVSPFLTDDHGYLKGRGEIDIGDQLLALLPVPITTVYSYTASLYYTNIIPSPTGVTGWTVGSPGVQQIVVSPAHPLVLLNLDISLEWDARGDARFMAQLQHDLLRTSEILFNWSNGQIALGQIHIFHNRLMWDFANVRIYSSNRFRPNAVIGGSATQVLTDPTTLSTVLYGPGQIQIGAVWNRFGNSNYNNLSEDWPRTLAHELGHYALFLEDNYVGLNDDNQIVPITTCPSVMSDYYGSVNFFQTRATWLPGCADTLSNRATGRTDWETITLYHPALIAPTGALSSTLGGPSSLPLGVTQLRTYSVITPSTTLDVPIFYTSTSAGSYQPGLRARGYLFQANPARLGEGLNQVVSLGRANLNQLLARGASPGDRVCLFEPAAELVGCKTIVAGDDQLPLAYMPNWPPDIVVTPVTSSTLALTVTGALADGLSLHARLFPSDNLPVPPAITFTGQGGGVYTGAFHVDYPIAEAYLHLWVDETEPRREFVAGIGVSGNPGLVTVNGQVLTGGGQVLTGGGQVLTGGGQVLTGGGQVLTGGGQVLTGGGQVLTGGGLARGGGGLARGGSGQVLTGGGFARSGNAPASTAEGDVMLVGDNLHFAEGQFIALQSTASVPAPPPWATVIGNGYRFTTSPSAPDLGGAALSFNYLPSEVPTGEEDGIKVYYRSPSGSGWTVLPTTRNPTASQVSVSWQGPGLYVLMSSIDIGLTGPGWNLFSYPIHATRPVSDALRSIDGAYASIYSYVPMDSSEPWKLYSPTAPAWVNTLSALEFGKGYWINITSTGAITLSLQGSPSPSLQTATSGVPTPPSTYYGAVRSGRGFTPAPGLQVIARVGGVACGGGQTRLIGGQVVYVVHVLADGGGATSGCGVAGRTVTFQVGDQVMGTSAAWDNGQLHPLDLSVDSQRSVYLPLVVR